MAVKIDELVVSRSNVSLAIADDASTRRSDCIEDLHSDTVDREDTIDTLLSSGGERRHDRRALNEGGGGVAGDFEMAPALCEQISRLRVTMEEKPPAIWQCLKKANI